MCRGRCDGQGGVERSRSLRKRRTTHSFYSRPLPRLSLLLEFGKGGHGGVLVLVGVLVGAAVESRRGGGDETITRDMRGSIDVFLRVIVRTGPNGDRSPHMVLISHMHASCDLNALCSSPAHRMVHFVCMRQRQRDEVGVGRGRVLTPR